MSEEIFILYKRRNPTPDDSLDFKWKPMTQDRFQFLQIKENPEMKDDNRTEVKSYCID